MATGDPPKPQEIALTVTWPKEYQTGAANIFRFSRVLDEVQMIHGLVRLSDITELLEQGEMAVTVEAAEVGSLMMGARAFKDLYDKVSEIYEAMVASGVYGGSEQDEEGVLDP